VNLWENIEFGLYMVYVYINSNKFITNKISLCDKKSVRGYFTLLHIIKIKENVNQYR